MESSSVVGGRRWKKKQKLKITSQKPFKLRTEVIIGNVIESFFEFSVDYLSDVRKIMLIAAKGKDERGTAYEEGKRYFDRRREIEDTDCTRSSMDHR